MSRHIEIKEAELVTSHGDVALYYIDGQHVWIPDSVVETWWWGDYLWEDQPWVGWRDAMVIDRDFARTAGIRSREEVSA